MQRLYGYGKIGERVYLRNQEIEMVKEYPLLE